MKSNSNTHLNYRLILALALLLLTTRIGLGSFFTSASDITPDNVASAINSERTQRNIQALNYNTALAAAAQYKASDIIARNYFAHVDPDGNYIWPKIVAEGYTPYTILGENLAVDFSDTAGLVAAWIDSPTHRDNILNPNFKDQGMGVATGNASQGQFAIAIANTFGAQPAASPAKTAPKPTPAPAPKPTPTPAPAPKPTPTPTPVSPAPTPAPNPAPSPTQTNPTSQNPQTNFTPPKIDTSTAKLTAAAIDEKIDLHIAVKIDGEITNASATVVDQTAALKPDPTDSSATLYTGDVLFNQYIDYTKQNLVISAYNGREAASEVTLPLKDLKLSTPDPKKISTQLAKNASTPDLYNVFKYVVIIFGGLFVFFLVIDTFKIGAKGRNKSGPGLGGSGILLILILIGTTIFVNWWH